MQDRSSVLRAHDSTGLVLIPASVDEVVAVVASGADFRVGGHTEWPDGRAHHTEFTAVLAPNTFAPYLANGVLSWFGVKWNFCFVALAGKRVC